MIWDNKSGRDAGKPPAGCCVNTAVTYNPSDLERPWELDSDPLHFITHRLASH